jgi:hypothetical protein
MLKSYLKKIFTIGIILLFGMGCCSISGESINGKYIITMDENNISLNKTSYTNFNNPLFENPPNELWDKTYGGSNRDYGKYVQQTKDNGYIITGSTKSYGNGDLDIWLLKTDINGNELWNKTYGGQLEEWSFCVKETSDSGFIISGGLKLNSEDDFDTWLIKTDNYGNMVWNKIFSRKDAFNSGKRVLELNDGYLTMSQITYHGSNLETDIWLIKTDFNGNEQWNKTIGSEKYDSGNAIIQTRDGNFVIVGYAYFDLVLLIKTDINGNRIWRKTYDGWEGFDIKECDNGDYIIAGKEHVCLIRTDKDGNFLWKNEYQWGDFDSALSVDIIPGKGYIVTGIGTYNSADLLIIKTDLDGNREWEKIIGDNGSDSGGCVIYSNDNTYVIVGSLYRVGAWDAWLVKVAPFENQRPMNLIFNGPLKGRPLIDYIYSVNSTELDDQQIYYWCEWGDNTVSPWQGPFESGELCEYSKFWFFQGNYIINVKARDIYGGDSEWKTIEVSISRIRSYILFFNIFESIVGLLDRLANL